MKWFVVFCALVASQTVMASRERGFFMGAGFGLLDAGVSDSFDNNALFKTTELSFGAKYNWFLGFDVRAGLSPTDETISLGVSRETGLEVSGEATIDSYLSYYYRAEWAGEVAKLYMLLGSTEIDVSVENEAGVTTEASTSGNSYGLGVGVWINRRMDFTVEYKQLLDTEADSFTIVSANIEYRF